MEKFSIILLIMSSVAIADEHKHGEHNDAQHQHYNAILLQ